MKKDKIDALIKAFLDGSAIQTETSGLVSRAVDAIEYQLKVRALSALCLVLLFFMVAFLVVMRYDDRAMILQSYQAAINTNNFIEQNLQCQGN